jgi:Ca2+-binding RTX toxin-like protein
MPLIVGTALNDNLTGSSVYDVIAGLDGDDVITDGGGAGDELHGGPGNDTYFVTAPSTIIEAVDAGYDTVRTTLATFTLPANVDYLYFDSAIAAGGIGNALDNRIYGNLGGDTLIGLDGNDLLFGAQPEQAAAAGAPNTLIGGPGNDYYYVYVIGDSTIELPGEGSDLVITTLSSFELQPNVESLTYLGNGDFSGAGNELTNTITGYLGRDSLAGRGGDDYLSGGNGAANELVGGPGDDVYYSDAAGDSIVEYAGEGIDEVRVSLYAGNSFTLPANVENLRGGFQQAAWIGVGNALNNVISGDSGRDTLVGLGGDDILEGYRGGGAADEMFGGTGNDRYYVAAAGTSVIEYAGEGTDEIITTLAHFELPPNVERLIFANAGFYSNPHNASGVGNASNNVIYGNDRDNVLNGGAGDDRLIGFGGYDTLIGGSGADIFYMASPSAGPDRILDFESGVDRIAIDPNVWFTSSVFDLVQGASPPAPTSFNPTMIYDSTSGTLHLDRDGAGSTAPQLVAYLNPGLTLIPADFFGASPYV